MSLYLEELECQSLRREFDVMGIEMDKDFSDDLLYFSVKVPIDSKPIMKIGGRVRCTFSDMTKENRPQDMDNDDDDEDDSGRGEDECDKLADNKSGTIFLMLLYFLSFL